MASRFCINTLPVPTNCGAPTWKLTPSRPAGAWSTRHRPAASDLAWARVKPYFNPSASSGGAYTSTLAPATWARDSSITTPPIAIPGTSRTSLKAGRRSGWALSFQLTK